MVNSETAVSELFDCEEPECNVSACNKCHKWRVFNTRSNASHVSVI